MGDARIVIRERGYFSLPRSAAQDDRLALETRGLLALMLSLPPDWDYTVTGLAVKAGCGRDKMRRMVRELEAVGYLVREQAHDEGGRFDGNVYVLQETPPLSGKPDNGETRRRETPSTEFSTQSKNVETKDYIIPPYSPPKGDGEEPRKRRSKTTPTWKPERFEGFWAYYPRGENRMGAVRAWDKLKPDDALIETIGRALQVLKASPAWRDGVGIPYASTFLNGRRWEDAKAKRPAQSAKAQTVRRIEQPPDSQDGGWTWAE